MYILDIPRGPTAPGNGLYSPQELECVPWTLAFSKIGAGGSVGSPTLFTSVPNPLSTIPGITRAPQN